MRVSVFGLGYVGSVTAVCMADLGHDVVGVDIHGPKVERMREGRSPVREPGLDEKLQAVLDDGRLQLTMDSSRAVGATECSLVAVGTPSGKRGSADLSAVQRCVESIATALEERPSSERHSIVIRSTVPPGTTGQLLDLAADVSGRTRGESLLGGMNPEFLREGSAIEDFYDPEVIVLGAEEDPSHDVMQRLYGDIEAETVQVGLREAEIVKYVNNAFHALKVAFANEIGRLSDVCGVDGAKVMDIVCRDRKLNISTAYLRPGFAFGGSCLPKDLRALVHIAQAQNVKLPLIASVSGSNDQHIQGAISRLVGRNPKRIGLLGAAFKSGTDDVRESAALRLARGLLDRGIEVRIHDANVRPASLLGASRRYLLEILPEWQEVFVDSVADAVDGADLVVFTTEEEVHRRRLESIDSDAPVVDLSQPGHVADRGADTEG